MFYCLILKMSPPPPACPDLIQCPVREAATLCRGAHGTIWQHTATHCNTLQYTATYCNTRHHTLRYHSGARRHRSAIARPNTPLPTPIELHTILKVDSNFIYAMPVRCTTNVRESGPGKCNTGRHMHTHAQPLTLIRKVSISQQSLRVCVRVHHFSKLSMTRRLPSENKKNMLTCTQFHTHT